MTRLLAGFLFAAAHSVTWERARKLDSEQWADLIDAENWLYLMAIA